MFSPRFRAYLPCPKVRDAEEMLTCTKVSTARDAPMISRHGTRQKPTKAFTYAGLNPNKSDHLRGGVASSARQRAE